MQREIIGLHDPYWTTEPQQYGMVFMKYPRDYRSCFVPVSAYELDFEILWFSQYTFADTGNGFL